MSRPILSFAIGVLGWALAGDLPRAEGAPGQSFEQARDHWAFRPIERPPIPSVTAADAVSSPVDAFLLEKLESRSLGFAPRADARTLLRRVYFDLIGLPPTYEEVEAFAGDASTEALAGVVDRLLADPRYGERWGRHWLDVARYADTKDLVLLYGRDAIRPYAYTYRDYVVRAFNEDLPFDAFVRDQLAADLVEPKVPGWRLAALGFLTLGRLFDNNPHDQIDDQIDTVSRGLLGLTVACARCHDHKFDAITMEDYYGLYGVFASTERPYALPLIEDPAAVTGGMEFEERLGKARAELESHIDAEFARLTEVLRLRVGNYLVRAATTKPDLTETAQFALSLTPDDFRPRLMLRTRRYVEERARPEDSVFGPWSVAMAALEAAPAIGRDSIASDAVTTALRTGGGASRWNPMVVRALMEASPVDRAGVAKAYGDLLRRLYEASKAPADVPLEEVEDRAELLEVVAGRDGPVAFERRDTPDHMSRPEKDRYGSLALALDKVAAHATNAPPARAMVVADLPERVESRVFLRGNPSRPERPAPQGYLSVLGDGEAQRFGKGSGRLELAAAITDPSHPLAARVFMNRVWMHHFGEPLVASPGDFGTRSDPPTHPALLDWLAREFIASGWRLKAMHRHIVLSNAYQQSPIPDAALVSKGEAADPDNRLLWRFPRRRLDVEVMRDSMLAVSGRLEPTMRGRPVDVAEDPENRRRTLYGLIDRQNLPGLFRSFDFAIPDQCAERRPRTTVPQQALYALNSPFVQVQAIALAQLPEVNDATEDRERVQGLFRRVLGRSPNEREEQAALAFLKAGQRDLPDGEARPGDWTPLAQLAQALLISNEAVFTE